MIPKLIFGIIAFTFLFACNNPDTDSDKSKKKTIESYFNYLENINKQELIDYSKSEDSILKYILQNTNGIRQNDNLFFNVEGYQIWAIIFPNELDNSGIEKIRKEFSIKSSNKIFDKSLKNVIQFTWQESESKNISINNSYYLYKLDSINTQVVGFSTALERDSTFERTFVKALMNNKIPNEVYSNWNIDSIKFAGRQIPLGPVCVWQNPNNIQCSGYGQMNWSEFRSFNRTVQMIRTQLSLNEADWWSKDKKINIINIDFEGINTKALRIEKKVRIPKTILGGSNRIIIYYIVAHVRNRYVGCVLSHYDDESKEGELPDLLDKIMKLKE